MYGTDAWDVPHESAGYHPCCCIFVREVLCRGEPHHCQVSFGTRRLGNSDACQMPIPVWKIATSNRCMPSCKHRHIIVQYFMILYV